MAEPLLHWRFGNRTWDGILRGTAAITLGSIGIILWLPGATTLVVFVLLTLGCHGPLSPFLPATYEPILACAAVAACWSRLSRVAPHSVGDEFTKRREHRGRRARVLTDSLTWGRSGVRLARTGLAGASSR
jgi:hypothetical protein